MSQSSKFPSEYHYVRLAVSPSNSDALVLRKTLQDSLTQTFGITASSTYIDILWVADGGDQLVVRVGNGDAAKILAAIVAWSDSPRLSMLKESPFLPSLLFGLVLKLAVSSRSPAYLVIPNSDLHDMYIYSMRRRHTGARSEFTMQSEHRLNVLSWPTEQSAVSRFI